MTAIDDIPEPYRSAHEAAFRNRDALLAAKWVGCFYCGVVFKPRQIREWVQDQEKETGICPICGIDSLIPMTPEMFDSDFLERMHTHWFAVETE